jgi:hypothetical protein
MFVASLRSDDETVVDRLHACNCCRDDFRCLAASRGIGGAGQSNDAFVCLDIYLQDFESRLRKYRSFNLCGNRCIVDDCACLMRLLVEPLSGHRCTLVELRTRLVNRAFRLIDCPIQFLTDRFG